MPRKNPRPAARKKNGPKRTGSQGKSGLPDLATSKLSAGLKILREMRRQFMMGRQKGASLRKS